MLLNLRWYDHSVCSKVQSKSVRKWTAFSKESFLGHEVRQQNWAELMVPVTIKMIYIKSTANTIPNWIALIMTQHISNGTDPVPSPGQTSVDRLLARQSVQNYLTLFILVTWHLFFYPSCCSPEGFFTFLSLWKGFLRVFPDPMWGPGTGMSYVYRL